MATIIASKILSDRPQCDGSRHVRERHVDSTGAVHEYHYIAPAEADPKTILADRAAWLPGWLAQREQEIALERAERGEPTGELAWAKPQAVVNAVRGRYRTARGEAAANLAAWLLARSNAELQEAFGLNAGQTTALKARLANGPSAKAALQALEGE